MLLVINRPLSGFLHALSIEGPFPKRLDELGFRSGISGGLMSRTMMLDELSLVLAQTPEAASLDQIAAAITDGNILGKPGIKWDKDRGTEPQRDKSEYPWFWCAEEAGIDPKPGKDFTGNRWNDVHLTLATKRAAK